MRIGIRGIIPYVPRTGTECAARLAVGLVVLAGISGACSGGEEVTGAVTPSPQAPAPAVVHPDPPRIPRSRSRPRSTTGRSRHRSRSAGRPDVDGHVTVRVLDDDSGELAAIDVNVDCRRACPGTFGTELFFFVERRGPGWVEVSGTTTDGREAVSRVPVVLFPV